MTSFDRVAVLHSSIPVDGSVALYVIADVSDVISLGESRHQIGLTQYQ